ncbi:hypothetical protein ACTFJW_17830 [Clostridium cagae]
MTAKELAAKTVRDIAKRRECNENEFLAYQKYRTEKKKRKWSVKKGGYKW